MSTKIAGAVPKLAPERPLDPDFRCVVVAAEWNAEIIDGLLAGAMKYFAECGVNSDVVKVLRVPGTIELTFGARAAINALEPSAVIVFGCVIRGDTPHFDYVCQSVAQGVTAINAEGKVPVVFGVLTTDNLTQARERIGGRVGDKGYEAAQAAIAMANLRYRLRHRDV